MQQQNSHQLRSQEQKLQPAQNSPQQGQAERQLLPQPLPNSSFPLSPSFSSILFFFNLLFSLCPTPSSSYLNLAEGLTSADEDDPVGVIVWLPAPGKQARHEGGCCF